MHLEQVACPRCGLVAHVNVPAGKSLSMVVWIDPQTRQPEAHEAIARQLGRYGIAPSQQASYLRTPCGACMQRLPEGENPQLAHFVAVLEVNTLETRSRRQETLP